MKSFINKIIYVGVSGLLALGLAGQAAAVGIYTVDPSAFGSTKNPFDANFVQGNSSSLLEITSASTISGQGWVNFSGFALDNLPIGPSVTGLQVDYNMWATFTYTTELTGPGTIGAANTNYTITSLQFNLYGGAEPTGPFVAAEAIPNVIVPSAPLGTLIGSGSLISGAAAFTSAGGSAFNALADFELTGFGSTFFTDPVPFFNLTFSEFNNTAQGLTRNGDFIALNQSSGGVDFTVAVVPEPAMLALLGLGLIGLGFVRNNRRA